MTHYVPTIQQPSRSTCVSFPQRILHYTPNRNIYPQCQCARKKQHTPNRDIHPQWISLYTPNGCIHVQLNSNYTRNHNIHPQCNRLCLQRAYRYKTVSYLLCVLFLKNNGAKRDSHHIGIRRTVAEVPIRTEDVIRTSDAEGWRCTEQILPHVSFLWRIHGDSVP